VASGALGDPDWPMLRARLGELAEDGIPGAAVMLAEMLATGRGGRARPRSRARLAEAAAERGDPHGLRLLGWMRLAGRRRRVDAPAGSRRWNGPGAGRERRRRRRIWGCCIATERRGCRPILQAARDWFERARAEAGDGWGATHLARLLGDGDDSVPDDPASAFALFRAGDARGIAAATHGLALAYWDGRRAPDPGRARAVMTRAALAGFPRAFNDLGVMAETGVGGAPDPPARRSFTRRRRGRAIRSGAWNLADLLLNPGLPTDPAEGYAWCLWAEDNAPDDGAAAAYRGALCRCVGPAHRR
jgi:TPR repeat protein